MKLSKSAVGEVMRAMPRSVLCSAVRILRRHLSVEGLGPVRCSPVSVLACRPLESSGGLVYGGIYSLLI